MMLSDVCLSVAYVGPKSRTGRPRNTKIGIEVAHVTCDSDTTFKVQRSRSPGRLTHRSVCASRSCSGERGNVFTVGTYCYVAARRSRLGGARRLGAHRRRGAGYIVAAPAQLVHSEVHFCDCCQTQPTTSQVRYSATSVSYGKNCNFDLA